MTDQLKKALTLPSLILIAVGASIGSGIFLTPSEIAGYLHTPWAILGIWALGGLITLTGALTYAELGSMYPQAGGIYVYIREAFGDIPAFLYGWTQLVVINTGSIAALSIAFARYVGFLVPMSDQSQVILAATAIAVVTAINVMGVKTGGIFASVFTSFKLIGIALVIVVGIFLSSGATGSFSTVIDYHPTASAFGLALIGVLWSYGGWQHTSFLSGEAKDASRTVPLAMVYGALVVTLVYLLINVAYLNLLPVDAIISSKAVAADALKMVFVWGGVFIALLIATSTFGTAGIYTLSVPRIYFAMASDGLFFKQLAHLHPVYKTPILAIVIQSVWAIVLLWFWGTFSDLITYVAFIDWIFYLLAALSMVYLRYKRPTVFRPYRTWGYPIVPFIFITIVIWFLCNTLIGKPVQAIAGLILLGAGLPVFYLFKGKILPTNKV